MRTRIFCSSLFAALALSAPMHAQSKSTATESSCRSFAQEFYDWYLPNTHVKETKRNWESALEHALKGRRSAFDADLADQLERGQARAKREKETFLDFDPVLNSQDPGSHYVVDKATLKDGHCQADVYGFWQEKRSEKPDVVAQLVFKNGRWQFVDFHYPNAEYPDSKSLLAMLRFLRKSEENGAH